MFSIILKILPIILRFGAQTSTDANNKPVNQDSAIAYVEAIKVLRLACLFGIGVFFAGIISFAALFTLVSGIINLKELDRESLAWIEIGFGSVTLFVAIITTIILMSQSLWIRLFKIDHLIDESLRTTSSNPT
jgi:hypothetical protein